MTSQRLTVQEAAEVLGTSVDAVRMRVRRGSLPSEKDSDGRVHVWVDGDSSETKPRPDGESDALISAKDETIAVLREQLEAEREAHREARRIIAGLVQRMPELEAPQDQRGAPENAGEEPVRTEPRSGTGGPRESADRPPDTAEWPVRGGFFARGGGGCSVDEGRRDQMRRQQMLDDLARRQHATRRESLAELRHGLAVEELAERYDECMEEAGRSAGLREDLLSLAQVYSTELARRERERQGERMERLTRSITWLTWVITGATIVGVVLTAVGLFFGG